MSTSSDGGTITSFNNAPQAVDDAYSVLEDDGIIYFDVMSNDLGGKAKVLWSIDDGTTDGTTGVSGSNDGTIDLMSRDVAGVCEKSDLGARMWMTSDGRIGYDTSIFGYLGANETATDTFTYAIRMANGTLSWATVTVTITGSNDRPDISAGSGDSASATLAETDSALSTSGTLTVIDPDATDTVAVSVSGLSISGSAGTLTNAHLQSMLSLGASSLAADSGDASNLSWAFNSGSESFDYLAAGQSLTLTYTIAASDGNGGNDTQTVTITITGTNDAPVATPVVLTAIAEDSGGRLITQAELLAAVSDVDNSTAELTITSLGIASGNGTLVDNGNGTWTYTPAADDDGDVTFNYTVSDGDLTDSSTASMDITPVDDFIYVSPAPFTGTGDPNDFDDLGPAAGAAVTVTFLSGTETWNGTNGADAVDAGNGTDTIYGHDGNDALNGENGADISLYGQRGDDVLTGGSGADRIYGGSGNDTIYGNEAPASNETGDTGDTLYGGSGNDAIYGQGGNDTIIGGYGADALSGGGGADTFAYLSALDTGDTITGFNQSDGDTIDLTAFVPSSFVGALSEAGAVGPNQVGFMYFAGTNTTVVYVDTDGILGADLEISLNGHIPLVSSDFLFGA